MPSSSSPRTTSPAQALVLFDIDGTLLRRAGPHHRQALIDAVRHVARTETKLDGIAVAGMLDRDILTQMLKNAGSPMSHIRRNMDAIVARAQALYAESCPDLKGKVCPGARMLLYRLQRSGIPAGLVTGNLTQIGWTKMERSGLKPYLQFGAFAEMARDRAGLVKIAMRHARKQGWIDRHTSITLIGDHPNDILAARANGVRSVAVATGVIGAEELAKYSPDVLVPDLRALRSHQFLNEAVRPLQKEFSSR